MLKLLTAFLGLSIIAGCMIIQDPATRFDQLYGTSQPRSRVLTAAQYQLSLQHGEVSFTRDVQPILEKRCVVCHGCYDAPCQLKLESGTGIDRGAMAKPVYDGTRLTPAAPTRLDIDATDTAAWRAKGFYPVLNERTQDPANNLTQALLAQMILLKQAHPLPNAGPLPDSFDFTLDRKLQCPRIETFPDFAEQHPLWGMPYGLPGLMPEEQAMLLHWIEQGAHYTAPAPPPEATVAAVSRFEAFLNRPDLKHRLVVRYIYEHLFMGHLHFEGHAEREFFRLVRATTRPGEAIDEIATRRPYSDPGPAPFYYRLKPVESSIVDKNHLVYEIGDRRLQRWTRLFLDTDYEVHAWPGYAPEIAANPFLAFAEIPPKARYQFLLDDAYFFVSGFMKGPVCRGQVALNVIRDRFWVVFYDPEQDPLGLNAGFLTRQAGNLALPSERESEIGIGELLFRYSGLEQDYLQAKNAFLLQQPGNVRNSLAGIWDGGGSNRDAALTVFRHFDSASLSRGFIGQPPLTGWALDYPLLERIHYLLVAGFDVFGSIKHQAATRLFMDALRNEAENNFLSLLPARIRPDLYHLWYRGFFANIKMALDNPYYGYGKDSGIDYRTDDPRQELFQRLRERVAAAPDPLNDCRQAPCDRPGASTLEQRADRALRPLALLQGGGIRHLPELSYLLVHERLTGDSAVYSLVKNEALTNVAFMFRESARRLPEEDSLTIVPGFVGSYPSFFLVAEIEELPVLVETILRLTDQRAMTALADRFGIRRNDPRFWDVADQLNARYRRRYPVSAGLFDLNRYDNP